jgi:hypothetical protein
MHPSPNDILAVFGGDRTVAQSDVELPVRELSDLQIDHSSLPPPQHLQPISSSRDMASAIEGHVPGQSSVKRTPPPSEQDQLPLQSISGLDDANQFLLSELAAAATLDTVSLTSNAELKSLLQLCSLLPPHHTPFM